MEDHELAEIEPQWDSDESSDLKGQELLSGKTEEEEQWNQDPFTALMFGSRASGRPIFPFPGDLQQQSNPPKQGINYEELMVNVDKLVESAKGLKPLFQQIYPFIEQLWKKK